MATCARRLAGPASAERYWIATECFSISKEFTQQPSCSFAPEQIVWILVQSSQRRHPASPADLYGIPAPFDKYKDDLAGEPMLVVRYSSPCRSSALRGDICPAPAFTPSRHHLRGLRAMDWQVLRLANCFAERNPWHALISEFPDLRVMENDLCLADHENSCSGRAAILASHDSMWRIGRVSRRHYSYYTQAMKKWHNPSGGNNELDFGTS